MDTLIGKKKYQLKKIYQITNVEDSNFV